MFLSSLIIVAFLLPRYYRCKSTVNSSRPLKKCSYGYRKAAHFCVSQSDCVLN